MDNLNDNGFRQEDLIKIANMKMPFGKYKGRALIDLPEAYVIWFHKTGLPPGEIGRLLAQLYDIKANGLEYLFQPLRNGNSTQFSPPEHKPKRDLKSYKF